MQCKDHCSVIATLHQNEVREIFGTYVEFPPLYLSIVTISRTPILTHLAFAVSKYGFSIKETLPSSFGFILPTR